MSARHVAGWTIALIVCVNLAFFVAKWVVQGAYFGNDLIIITIPLENLYASLQRSGQSPLWAPELAGGYPLLAIGQLGFWYPPHMLLRQFLPAVWTLNLSLLLHTILATVGTFFFLKQNNVRNAAAGAGALLLSLGATFAGKYEMVNLILPFLWVPLLLFFLQRFLERGKVLFLLLWVVANVFSVLVGHPQMTVYLLFSEVIFTLCVTGLEWCRWPRALATVPGIVLVLGLTSVYLLPIIDNIPATDRASGSLQPNAAGMFDNQFTPAAFLGLILAHPFGHNDAYYGPTNENELSSYVGPLALGLAALGLFTGRRRFPTIWWFSVSLVVIGLCLAIGGYSPIFRWLVHHGWTYFHSPARFFLYAHIGLAFLMAVGLDGCLSSVQSKKPIMRILIGALLVGTIAPVLWVSWSWHTGVPWTFTREPAFIEFLRKEQGFVRILAGKNIFESAPDDDLKVWNPICSTCVYRQQFVSSANVISGLRIKLSGSSPNDGRVTLKLYRQDGVNIRESILNARNIRHGDWNVFAFRPVKNIADQSLYFEVSSDMEKKRAPRLFIYTNPKEQYDPHGVLYNCTSGRCTEVRKDHVSADAAFQLLTEPRGVDYYNALAPYVSTGFGIGSTSWVGSLPILEVKRYLQQIGGWGDPTGEHARMMANRFSTTHFVGLSPSHRSPAYLKGATVLATAPLDGQLLRLYRNDQAFPRVQFAHTVKAVPGGIDQVNAVSKLDPRDRETVVADIQGDTVFDTSGNTAEITHNGRAQVLIQTQQDADGFLVLRDVFLKDWVATIDDHPASLKRVDGVFRGVFVPAGEHAVSFFYKPRWRKTAVYIEIVSLVVFAVCVVYAFRQTRFTNTA